MTTSMVVAAPLERTGRRRWRWLRAALWRRKAEILLPLLAAAPIAWAADVRAPADYRATATVFLAREDVTALLGGGDPAVLDERGLQTEVELIRGSELPALVDAESASAAIDVDAQPVAGADAITMAVVARRPTVAAELANRYADGYVDRRRAERAQALRVQADELRVVIDQLQAAIDASRAADGVRPTTAGIAQRANDRAQRASLQQQLDLVEAQRGLVTGGAEVIDRAVAADAVPVDHGRVAALAILAVGLVAGLGLAAVRERFDDRVHGVEQLGSVLNRSRAAFVVPSHKQLRAGGVLPAGDNSPASESFRGLRAILPAARPADAPVVQITSAGEREGCTTTTANLAASSARDGWYTIVVEGDVTNPHLGRLYGVNGSAGLGGLIEDPATPAVTALAMPTHRRLGVMVSGAIGTDPGDLVSLPAVAERLSELRGRADVILVDSGSVRRPDALVWAQLADVTVVVARTGWTRRSELQDALERLGRAGASVVAVVLVGGRTDRLGCPR